MKYLFGTALLIFCLTAHSEAMFELRNQAGGKMILTDEKCRDNTHYLAYSMMPNYQTLLGCWSADSQYVHIGWYDGDLRSYPVGSWIFIGKNKPNL